MSSGLITVLILGAAFLGICAVVVWICVRGVKGP